MATTKNGNKGASGAMMPGETIVKNATIDAGLGPDSDKLTVRLSIWTSQCERSGKVDWQLLAEKFEECLELAFPQLAGKWELVSMARLAGTAGFHFDAVMVRVSA